MSLAERVWFQFTHPGGVRLSRAHYVMRQYMGFNSRTREGCDGHRGQSEEVRASFNSRTREGCDRL